MVDRLRAAAGAAWDHIEEIQEESFCLFIPSSDHAWAFCTSPSSLGAVSGYVRHDDVDQLSLQQQALDSPHNARFITEIMKDGCWPLGAAWTGSFAAVAHPRGSRDVVLCNDPIGYAPLYFWTSGRTIVGGTSLIVLGRTVNAEVDVVGVLQRITHPNHCNYGRRTLLKGVSRLLPGEWLRWSGSDGRLQSVLDNSLTRGVIDGDVDTVAGQVWDCLRREIAVSAGVRRNVGLALSGGWDSRLVLGGLAHQGHSIECYTYGSVDHYEVQIARRCALAVGARHRFFPIEAMYFPPRRELEGLVRATESANYMEWFSMIAAIRAGEQGKTVLFLGDLGEGVDGRYMNSLSSRAARRRSFLRGFLGQKDRVASSTRGAFVQWRQAKEKELIEEVWRSAGKLSPALTALCPRDLVEDAMREDLELSFMRVQDNMPPFVPMFDELFTWFHRVRFLMANQLQLLACAFRPICPGISLRFVRMISTAHPRMRMRRRLMDALARLPELDVLARIPSAQIPWLHARTPSLFRELLWGTRSGLDGILTRRVLRTKDAGKRQRVLRSLDLIAEYRRSDVIPRVQEWFSGNWVKSEPYVRLASERASLAAWPLINVDISAPANVSIILDLAQTN